MASETVDPVLSYAFNANAPAGSPLSYQSLLTRRKIAEALLSKRTALPFPKNLGEGLTYASDRLATAFGDKTELERLEAAQRAYDVQGERDVQSAAKTLYEGGGASAPDRRSDAGTETEQTASGVPPVPYVPSGEGSVPLPPPRPVVDRGPIINDANDPATARRLAAMTLGEGNPGASQAELQTQYATAPDRALATGITLPQALQTTAESPRGGYYPGGAIARGEQMLQRPGAYEAFQRDVATPVLRGADPGRGMFGFTPTQNASLGVASRGAANGTYSRFARSPTGELFARKPGERPPTPFPPAGPDTAEGPPGAVRDALAATITPPPPGIAPNARVASLGGGGPIGNAGAASAVIPPAAGVPPPAGAGPAVPPAPAAPYANPPIQTDIAPRPPQVAQAQVPPQVPPAARPFSPQTVPLSDAEPPKQTPISDNEKLATLQMIRAQNSGDLGRANTWKTVVDQLAAKRLFLDKQNEEMWKARTGRATTDISAAQAASRQYELLGAKGELPQQGPPPLPAGTIDPRLGTPASPQRKGYPDLPPVPAGITPQKHAEQFAPILAKRSEAFATAVPQFDEMIKAIDLARQHPGKDPGTGLGGAIARGVHGTSAYDFGTIINQLKGKNFLAVYQGLKGAGNISEKEGDKAEQAQARLDPSQSKASFDKALNDLELQLRGDLEVNQRRMNQPVTAWRRPGDNSSVAPDIGQRDGNMEYIGGNPASPNSWRRAMR